MISWRREWRGRISAKNEETENDCGKLQLEDRKHIISDEILIIQYMIIILRQRSGELEVVGGSFSRRRYIILAPSFTASLLSSKEDIIIQLSFLHSYRNAPQHCRAATIRSMDHFKHPTLTPSINSDHLCSWSGSPTHLLLEVKVSCFKGIVNPTDMHGSWGI